MHLYAQDASGKDLPFLTYVAIICLFNQDELSDAKSMIEEISAKQEEMQQKIEQLQQEKRKESRKLKAK